MGVLGDFEATDEEVLALKDMIDRNCSCAESASECPYHLMLRNVVLIKRWLFIRRMVSDFVLAEWKENASGPA